MIDKIISDMKTPAVELYLLVLVPLVAHLLHGAFAQQTQAEVRDGQVAGDRDNARGMYYLIYIRLRNLCPTTAAPPRVVQSPASFLGCICKKNMDTYANGLSENISVDK